MKAFGGIVASKRAHHTTHAPNALAHAQHAHFFVRRRRRPGRRGIGRATLAWKAAHGGGYVAPFSRERAEIQQGKKEREDSTTNSAAAAAARASVRAAREREPSAVVSKCAACTRERERMGKMRAQGRRACFSAPVFSFILRRLHERAPRRQTAIPVCGGDVAAWRRGGGGGVE